MENNFVAKLLANLHSGRVHGPSDDYVYHAIVTANTLTHDWYTLNTTPEGRFKHIDQVRQAAALLNRIVEVHSPKSEVVQEAPENEVVQEEVVQPETEVHLVN